MILAVLLISSAFSIRLSTRSFVEMIEEENIKDDMFNHDQFIDACTDTLYFAGYVRHGDLMIGDFCEGFLSHDKHGDKLSLK